MSHKPEKQHIVQIHLNLRARDVELLAAVEKELDVSNSYVVRTLIDTSLHCLTNHPQPESRTLMDVLRETKGKLWAATYGDEPDVPCVIA